MESQFDAKIFYIQKLTPLEIRNTSKDNLIFYINYQRFFDYINKDSLKSISNDIFNYLKPEQIKSLSIENIKLLVDIGKIEFLPAFALNQIYKGNYIYFPDNFYNQIQSNHIEKANKEILEQIISLDKLYLLNNKTFDSFCNRISFKDLQKQNIFSFLNELNNRNKFKNLTGENFLALEKYINEEKLEPYLKELKTLTYLDNKNEIKSHYKYKFNRSLLDENDLKSDEEIVINYDKIGYQIEEYINEEKYELLKIYCKKCTKNEDNKEKMLNTLNSLLKYSKISIYDLVDEFEIRKILILLNSNMEDNIKHYTRMKQIIIDMQNIDIKEPDEFMTKIMKYSEIVKGESFDIGFREILAEENVKYMKFVIDKFYSGSDKDSEPNTLKKIYVEIINDYMNVIEKKYSIKKDKIMDDLQKIDINNQEEELSTFINSLNNYEKLYYDLLLQLVLESPDSESWIKSYTTPIFKFMRNILLTIGGFKLASLTGSKTLLALSASIGGAMIFKDVKDEIIKSYFSLDEKGRKLYHLNCKNSPEKRISILTRKIKEKYRKYIKPVENFIINLFDTKIFHLKESPKIGLEKFLNKTGNIEKECEEFRNNELIILSKNEKRIKKITFQQVLLKIIKKLKYRRQIPIKINQFFQFKQKIFSRTAEFKLKRLKEKYPQYKDPTIFERIMNIGGKIKSFGCGVFKSFSNVFSFGITGGLFAKKNNLQNTLETINNIKYNEFKKELDKIQKRKEDDHFLILLEEIKYLTESSQNDSYLFNNFKVNNSNELREIEEEIAHLKKKISNNSELNDSSEIFLEDEKEDECKNLKNTEIIMKLLDTEETEINK